MSSKQAAPTGGYPWPEIRFAYAAGGESLRQLARRFGCAASTIRHRAAREGWTGERAQFRHQTHTKAAEGAAGLVAKRRLEMLKLGDAMKGVGVESLRRVHAEVEAGHLKLSVDQARLLIRTGIDIELRALGLPDLVVMSDEELNAAIIATCEELDRLGWREGSESCNAPN